jgi:hypothetical protein
MILNQDRACASVAGRVTGHAPRVSLQVDDLTCPRVPGFRPPRGSATAPSTRACAQGFPTPRPAAHPSANGNAIPTHCSLPRRPLCPPPSVPPSFTSSTSSTSFISISSHTCTRKPFVLKRLLHNSRYARKFAEQFQNGNKDRSTSMALAGKTCNVPTCQRSEPFQRGTCERATCQRSLVTLAARILGTCTSSGAGPAGSRFGVRSHETRRQR